MPAALALLASALWGTSDFAGGLLSRRLPVLRVLLPSQLLALCGLVVSTTALRAWTLQPQPLGWGAASGAVGVVALACFYRGLATGMMGVVAPVAATGVAVPVFTGVLRGERPHAVQVAGIVVAVIGVVLAARPPASSPVAGLGAGDLGPGRRPAGALRPLGLALVAAAGFGLVLTFVADGSGGRHGSVAMTLVSMRVVDVALLGAAALIRRPAGPLVVARDLPALALVGAFDVTANGIYALASRGALVSVVAVLASLYPVMTVLLARRVLAERMAGQQAAGVALALTGVVLLAAG